MTWPPARFLVPVLLALLCQAMAGHTAAETQDPPVDAGNAPPAGTEKAPPAGTATPPSQPQAPKSIVKIRVFFGEKSPEPVEAKTSDQMTPNKTKPTKMGPFVQELPSPSGLDDPSPWTREDDLIIDLLYANVESPRLLRPDKIDSHKKWRNAVEEGRLIEHSFREDTTEKISLVIRANSKRDHSYWNRRVLVVGVAEDDVEWVLAAEPQITLNVPSHGADGVARIPLKKIKGLPAGGASGANELYYFIRGKIPGDWPLSAVATLQVRVKSDDKTGAIMATYLIDEPWKWKVLQQEGLIVDFPPPAKRRFVRPFNIHHFELVAYPGTPHRPESYKITRLELQVTGCERTTAAFPDRTKNQYLLTDREFQPGEVEKSSPYHDFSEIKGVIWPFTNVLPP